MSNADPHSSERTSPAIALQMISAVETSRLVFVDHDDFTIGGGSHCDLCLTNRNLGRLHSVLHIQGAAIWIEAVHPDAMIVVNDEVFRWRALRDGDRLTFDDVETFVHIGEESIEAARRQMEADLHRRQEIEAPALLSAEELCDRIEAEEIRVADFDRGRRFGWEALLSAVQEIIDRDDEDSHPHTVSVPLVAAAPDQTIHELADQVRHLSETLDERNRTLAAQEAQLVESSSQLCEAQRRVSRQLDQLMERLAPNDDHPGELRVSA